MNDSAPTYLSYFDRLVNLDRPGAMELLERFLKDHGGDIEALYSEVLMPALVHAGGEWEAARISVAHEHYISEVTRDFIFRSGPRLWGTVTPGSDAPVAVTCAAPDERHVLGLMMVGDLLKATGLVVHNLGEGAPAESVAGFVSQTGADLLAVSVGLPEHVGQAAELVAAARSARPGLLVIAGGNALREAGVCERLGVDACAVDLPTLRQVLPDLQQRLRAARATHAAEAR